MSSPGGRPQNVPLLAAGAFVVLAAIVAIAVGVNQASNSNPPVSSASASATATATATATPTPTATPALIPYADCSSATFGSALQPLNPPADVHRYPAQPPMTIDVTKLYLATITTSKGTIGLCLQPQLAPITVNNFVTLARNHYYDGVPFHRVVSGFVIQAGDPTCIGNVPSAPATPSGGCGSGTQPGYKFADEPVHQMYVAGCVAMANSGPNTNASQFFICIADDTTALQPKYNLFGKVATGMNITLQIVQGDVIQSLTVIKQQ
jgi:cyclophilin family peptidyl-prolyl cis-trans isomerase